MPCLTTRPPPRRLERLLQFNDARADELDAAVSRVGERVEDFPVEDERAHDLPGVFQRVVQGGMVEVAQIAAKPDQGAGVFGHGVLGRYSVRRGAKTCLLDLRQITMGRQS